LCDDLFLAGQKSSELDQVNIEHRLKHKSGEWRWFTVSISSVSNADGKLLYYICVGHDVSERIRAEEELRRALIDTIRETEKQKMVADQASQLKSELLEIAAHDLKNPLTSILGFSQMIQLEAEEDTSVAESAQLIEQASQRMLKIISQLIQGSALESGELELEKELFDISVVSDFVITNNKPLATQKKQKLIPALEEDLMVHGEMDRIIEIIDNLISNAIKYSPIGGKIWINLTQENGNARFEIIDEGPGLSDEEQTKLFKKFTRLSPEPTGGETSTGLGLSIVKKLVELHDGDVGVESEPGNGSKFYFTIPLEK
jgi:signal transduction histidine kinase